jgi:hypothetical protein
MPRLLTCPQGHQWELPESNGGSTGLQVLCPLCGAAVDFQEPARPEPASAETGTFHPAGSNQSEAETLTPKLQVGRTDLKSVPPEVLEVLPAPGESAPVPEIAGYEFLALLGRGGMGMVYKARQTTTDALI